MVCQGVLNRENEQSALQKDCSESEESRFERNKLETGNPLLLSSESDSGKK